MIESAYLISRDWRPRRVAAAMKLKISSLSDEVNTSMLLAVVSVEQRKSDFFAIRAAEGQKEIWRLQAGIKRLENGRR